MLEMWRRLRYLFNRMQYERDLADEMRLHRDLVGQASPRSFGNVTQLQEASRAVWVWPFLETLAQDTRYALRTLRANPVSPPRPFFPWRWASAPTRPFSVFSTP
jgi:hypothetical protein